ncbi:MAG: RagB/SusD family nutrient uptake outer membrane protein [Chitinophagaceae bacterium]|nr:RagB/SusD family nutrient uptake outer membrane protein [Chitinophagaceae bacterium]
MNKHRHISSRYYQILFVAALLLVQTACTKHILDAVPPTNLSDAAAYSTPEKILAGVNAMYSQVQSASYYGGRFIIFNEQRGDEFSQNDGNNSTGANVWNQSITGSGDFVNAVWTAAYASINSANLIIKNISNSTVVGDSLRKNYLAEAKFIRAFNYFNLVQTYAKPYAQDKNSPGLPLRLAPSTTGGDNSFPFSKVADVYTQVLKDLDEAEADLPASYGSALLNVSRAHKATAIALKTRVYLVQGDYPAVIKEAVKLVPSSAPYQYTAGSVTHKLEANIATVFNGTYTGAEAVFFLPFVNPSEAPGNQSALAYNYLYPILPLNTAGIAADPVFSSASTDARKTSLTKTNVSGQLLLNKFTKNVVPYNDYIPVIRYAEVLLNYAEAAAGTSDVATAVALLGAVRHRSDPSYVFDPASLAADALPATILNERRIELLGEGFRLADLLRKVQTLPAKTGNAGTAPAVAPTASNYVWPVPSGELAYNPQAPR